MTTHDHDSDHNRPIAAKPYAIVGAGKLASTIWKSGDEESGWRYHFNLFRLSPRGRVGQRFTPGDVLSLVKLAKILAAELANDGCLSAAHRRELTCLASALNRVTHATE